MKRIAICGLLILFAGCTPSVKNQVRSDFSSLGMRNLLVVVETRDKENDEGAITSAILKSLKAKGYHPVTELRNLPQDGGIPVQGVVLAYFINYHGFHSVSGNTGFKALSTFEPSIAIVNLRSGEKISTSEKSCAFLQIDCYLTREKKSLYSVTNQPTWQTPYYTKTTSYQYTESEEQFIGRIVDQSFANLPSGPPSNNEAISVRRYVTSLIPILSDYKLGKCARKGIVLAGKQAVEPLLNALETTGDPWVAARASSALGEIADAKALPVLEKIKAGKWKYPIVGQEAAKAIGEIKSRLENQIRKTEGL